MDKLHYIVKRAGGIDGRPVHRYVKNIYDGIISARDQGYTVVRIYSEITDLIGSKISYAAFQKSLTRLSSERRLSARRVAPNAYYYGNGTEPVARISNNESISNSSDTDNSSLSIEEMLIKINNQARKKELI